MNKQPNPEIDRHLDALADICCEAIQGGEPVLSDRSTAILKSLLMSGYVRQVGPNLQADVENRVKEKCQDHAMNRGGELSGLTQQLQTEFKRLTQWESNQPKESSPPKAANYSSSTDS